MSKSKSLEMHQKKLKFQIPLCIKELFVLSPNLNINLINKHRPAYNVRRAQAVTVYEGWRDRARFV